MATRVWALVVVDYPVAMHVLAKAAWDGWSQLRLLALRSLDAIAIAPDGGHVVWANHARVHFPADHSWLAELAHQQVWR